ncbi:hypothetical protein F5Y10DRAFT_261012 [Nemania abortiva]|nr:hypothetical protein F5Y10DRAFT_261012 [Nemania abortiva]
MSIPAAPEDWELQIIKYRHIAHSKLDNKLRSLFGMNYRVQVANSALTIRAPRELSEGEIEECCYNQTKPRTHAPYAANIGLRRSPLPPNSNRMGLPASNKVTSST